jgi:hypothetical protein
MAPAETDAFRKSRDGIELWCMLSSAVTPSLNRWSNSSSSAHRRGSDMRSIG